MCLLWSKLNWVVDAQGKVVSNILIDLSWEMKHVRAFKQSLSIKENTVITVHSRKLNPWETEFCGIILMLRKGVCLIQSSLLQPSSQFMNKAYWKQFYLVQPYSSCIVEWMWALQQCPLVYGSIHLEFQLLYLRAEHRYLEIHSLYLLAVS